MLVFSFLYFFLFFCYLQFSAGENKELSLIITSLILRVFLDSILFILVHECFLVQYFLRFCPGTKFDSYIVPKIDLNEDDCRILEMIIIGRATLS